MNASLGATLYYNLQFNQKLRTTNKRVNNGLQKERQVVVKYFYKNILHINEMICIYKNIVYINKVNDITSLYITM